ncbi:phosphoribosylformylglycinamidine synthase [Linderina pennispora]|nr:phosphoribosylformylglycinamidine synthase [Linderina pennispora]
MDVLFGKPPKMSRTADSLVSTYDAFDGSLLQYLPELPFPMRVADAVARVLHLPSVASKSFLITIGDRCVTGLVARDPMVGPWQVPVADVAVTSSGYETSVRTGEAMAMGERPTLALVDAAAASRMAVAESLMNIAAADVPDLSWVKLSANWMAAPAHPGEGARLYSAVRALSELCQALGVSVPVGKDSMSMQMQWQDSSEQKKVTAPISAVITSFAAVIDTRKTLTPALQPSGALLFVDLAAGQHRMGGSALAQVYNQIGQHVPDVEDSRALLRFFNCLRFLRPHILAYHDRSDGGLFTTLCEMAFAGHVGIDVDIAPLLAAASEREAMEVLFTEELGCVIQVDNAHVADVIAEFAMINVPVKQIGSVGCQVDNKDAIRFRAGGMPIYEHTRSALWAMWAETSYKMQRLRDNPQCADEEYSLITNDNDSGISYDLTFDPAQTLSLVPLAETRPRVAILREQGVNSHAEMAYAFHQAGFEAVDVHMTDIFNGSAVLSDFVGLAAVGGFSYGDVLGAGAGWAKSILMSPAARLQFKAFFERQNTFALGVCNGCQMLSNLRDVIPGTEDWPYFVRNESEQYEGRVVMVEPVASAESAKVFFDGLQGSKIPIVVAHGEGRAKFASPLARQQFQNDNLQAFKYVDRTGSNHGDQRIMYPMNPNGADLNLAGVLTKDGRVLAMMPHPERAVRIDANSYVPADKIMVWEQGPWARMFVNARRWVADNY